MRRQLKSVFLALRLSHLFGEGVEGAYNWIAFHSALEGSVKGTIEASLESAASVTLAEAIVQNLYSVHIQGRPGSGFGVFYTALVWEDDIRPAFADIIKQGHVQHVVPNARGVTCGHGMVPLLWTAKDGPPDQEEVAWPSLKGGSVAVTVRTARGTTMNCMVFYNTPFQGLVNNNEHSIRVTACLSVIKLCEGRFSRFARAYTSRIDLTDLAVCIFSAYPDSPGIIRLRNKLIKLRGLAVFPSYHEPWNESSGYGLHSDNGRFYLTCTEDIPVVNVEEHPTLAVCYGILFSETHI